jgi:hypothetical protein
LSTFFFDRIPAGAQPLFFNVHFFRFLKLTPVFGIYSRRPPPDPLGTSLPTSPSIFPFPLYLFVSQQIIVFYGLSNNFPRGL